MFWKCHKVTVSNTNASLFHTGLEESISTLNNYNLRLMHCKYCKNRQGNKARGKCLAIKIHSWKLFNIKNSEKKHENYDLSLFSTFIRNSLPKHTILHTALHVQCNILQVKTDNFFHLHLKTSFETVHNLSTECFWKNKSNHIPKTHCSCQAAFIPPNINHLSGHMPHSLVHLYC